MDQIRSAKVCVMEVIPLQSGSTGNCIYVESSGVRLLFDAGISGRQAELRLKRHGKNIRDVDALVISHDHSDHTRSLGALNRKFGLPVFVSRLTLKAVQRYRPQGELSEVSHFESGEAFAIGSLSIETIRTPHDAADGVAFVVDDGKKRFGLLTDLGHVFRRLHDIVPTLDAVLLESNYDPEMLIHCRYPDMVKTRIAGKRGHLSNADAAELLACASPDLQWAVLAHLSEESNCPEVALRTHREKLGSELLLQCADRHEASPPMKIQTPSQRKTPPSRLTQKQLFQ